MRSIFIGKSDTNRPAISDGLEQITLNAVRNILPDSLITRACHDVGYTFRRRALTPVVTVLHMLLAAIWPEESFQASASLIWNTFTSAFGFHVGKAPSSGSWAKARARLPLAVWQKIHHAIAKTSQELSVKWDSWRGHRVVLVDGTCVSMPDQIRLHRRFGRSTGKGGKRHYPLARMVALCLANTMTIIDYAVARYRCSEKMLLQRIIGKLNQGDLLVADRHFAGANLYVGYLRNGLEFLTRAHQRLRIDRLKRVWVHNDNDIVVKLPVNKNHRKQNPSLPKFVIVRLVRAQVTTRAGRGERMWFATSLLDAETYPADEIIMLYADRWRIETLFRELKIRLDADVLRSRTVAGVQKELAARVVALNVIRAIMLQAAIEHAVEDPLRISFAEATRAILAASPILAVGRSWLLMDCYAAMLHTIAKAIVPHRPGRQEPRAIRRELQHYPRLKITRKQWRDQWKTQPNAA